MFSDLGLAVSRQIPADQVLGIVLGTHSVHGGVIRDGLGRITSHLVNGGATSLAASFLPGLGTLGSLINAGQLYSIGRDVQQVQQTANTILQVSMAGTALAGLGVVTSVAGFAYLSYRLNKIDDKLSRIEKDIKAIKSLLQCKQKAELHTAIDHLRQAELTTNEQLRHDLLMRSKELFTTLAHFYREQWVDAGEIHQIDGLDEYFTLAFTGAALATSELGMSETAATELQRHFGDWQMQARRHCGKHLLGDAPQRLMDESLVNDLSTRELVDTLDFVNGTRRGIDWIDDLRRQNTSLVPAFHKALPGALQRFVAPASEKPAIDFSKRLQARNSVLSANVAHFDFLANKKISASYFAGEVKKLVMKHKDTPVCISGAPVSAQTA